MRTVRVSLLVRFVTAGLLAACTSAEAPVPPSVSISPRTVTVGDTAILSAALAGVPPSSIWWLAPADLHVAQGGAAQGVTGGVYYGAGAGTTTLHVQVVADTGAKQHVAAEDSTVLTVMAPPASNRPAFTAIEASADRGCGLTAGGDVYCWGNTRTFHTFGATCERSFHQSYPTYCNSVPAKVNGVPPLKFMDGGGGSVCGITLTDEAFCWSALAQGAFGKKETVPGGIRFTSISVEMSPNFFYEGTFDRICGLTSIGDVYCWIRGDSSTAPVKVPGNISYKAVAVGGWEKGSGGLYRACGLDMSGAAFCWGNAALGDGNPMPASEQTSPVPVGDTLRFQAITLGGLEACGLTLDGSVYCWYGDPFHPDLVPTLVDTPLRFKAISAQDQGFCGIATDSSLYCWSSYPQVQPPKQISTTFHLKTISVGSRSSCGLTVEGPEVCWGDNSWGFVGNGVIGGSVDSPTPVAGKQVLP